MDEPWDGTERRVADKRFAAAMTEVHDLRVGVAALAEAVKVRDVEVGKGVRQVALLLAGLFILLVVFSLTLNARFNQRLDRGHDLITCLLLVDPGQRTAQTLIDCQRGTR